MSEVDYYTGYSDEENSEAWKAAAIEISRSNQAILIASNEKDFPDRTAEARFCLNRAKANLKNSRNIKTEIKNRVLVALDRLYEIVKEMDKEIKGKTGTVTEKKKKNKNNKEQSKQDDQNDILKQLNENTKSIQEYNLKLEELRKTIERNNQQEPRSYSSVVANTSTIKQPQNPMHTIIVASKDYDDTGEQVLSKIRDTIDAKEGWVKVEKIRKARDRKIIMSVGSKEERTRIRDKLEKTGKLTCEEVNNKDPLLVLMNVLSAHSDKDILTALRNQNKEIFQDLTSEEDRMEIKYRRRARNPLTNHTVIRVSPVIWKRALNQESLHLDLQRVKVKDQSPLIQCTRCLGYGHSKRFCKESTDACSHCGGPHLKNECNQRNAGTDPSCINCSAAKCELTNHDAFSGECPIRQRWDRLARSSVAYC